MGAPGPTRSERFESVFRENYALVRAYALRRAPRSIVQDVVAETFLVAWRVSVLIDSQPRHRLFTRYLVYERVPLDARSRAQLDLDSHPGATCAPGAAELRRGLGPSFANPCPLEDRAGPSRAP
jgi:hypothetical protein